MSTMIFVVSLPMWRLSLFVQQSPAAPYWRSCAAEDLNSAITNVSYAASQTLILRLIRSKAVLSRFILYFTLFCKMTSQPAADCHFRQDAHRRMASVIARIRSAEERERGEGAQDHLLMVRNFSYHCVLRMPLNCIQSQHLQTAPRQTRAILCSGRGAEDLHRSYKWSWILQTTKPRLRPGQFTCGKFTARLTL
jgi:hypothetical protein